MGSVDVIADAAEAVTVRVAELAEVDQLAALGGLLRLFGSATLDVRYRECSVKVVAALARSAACRARLGVVRRVIRAMVGGWFIGFGALVSYL